jgi:hypothetical protein
VLPENRREAEVSFAAAHAEGTPHRALPQKAELRIVHPMKKKDWCLSAPILF